MTKLPDEIENAIEAVIQDNFIHSGIIDRKVDYKQRLKDIIYKHLGKYLTHPTDEGIEPIEKLLGVDHPANGDRGCKIYGYVEKGIAVITRVEYVDLPKEVEGIEKEEPTQGHKIPNPIMTSKDFNLQIATCPRCGYTNQFCICEHNEFRDEVKPPTKDTIEKIDPRDLITRGEEDILRYGPVRWSKITDKINELVDKSNHQQEQIQQLLSK